jgi:hypothetical protein
LAERFATARENAQAPAPTALLTHTRVCRDDSVYTRPFETMRHLETKQHAHLLSWHGKSAKCALCLLLLGLCASAQLPEPPGWFAGDVHVHLDCGVAGGLTVTPDYIFKRMQMNHLAVVGLLADMGNAEVRDAPRDLPKINGKDFSQSTRQQILHWDAEWHYDPRGVTFEQKAIGGHLILLGLRHGEKKFSEYTYPVIEWAKQRRAVVGLAHMQYLHNDIPQDLDCCSPLEYPVETALGSIDFLMEDVNGGESAIQAYYRLLNCGFRPGFAASTDFPCNRHEAPGTLLTYVRMPGEKLSYRGWIEGLAKGRTVVSRGAHDEFLNLKVNGTAQPGDEVRLKNKGTVRVSVLWPAAKPMTGRIELVRNGVVVASQDAKTAPGSPALLEASQEFARSGWLCARRMDAKGHRVHTGAVFLSVDGAKVRASSTDAEFFVRFIDHLIRQTSPGGAWSDYFPHEREPAQNRYRLAKAIYERIAAEAKAQGN